MDENEKKRSKAEGWLMAVGVLLVVYVLSIGPAARWKMTHGGVDDAFWRVYGPVKWLHNHSPLETPIGRYYDWWCR